MSDGREARDRRPTVVVAVAFIVLQLAYQLAIQPFSAPDEQAHLSYVRALSDDHRLPTLEALPQRVRDTSGRTIGWTDAPTGLPGPHTPEAQQPPLAYLGFALLRAVTKPLGLGDRWLRCLGLLWGLLTILVLARYAERELADHPLAATTLPALVLLSGPVYYLAAVNNDGLSILLGAWLSTQLLETLTHAPERRRTVWLGLAWGLGLATKSTFLVFLPAVYVLVWLQHRRASQSRHDALLACGLVSLMAVLPVGWWWLHNHALYGPFLPRAHARPLLNQLSDLWTHADALSLAVVQLLITLVYWLPTALFHLWLLLPMWSVAMGIFLLIWAVWTLGLCGLRDGWAGLSDGLRRGVGMSLALLGLMTVLYGAQFWFQDFQVALFGGRYFLPLTVATSLPWLLGLEGAVEPERRRAAGWVVIALLVVLALVLYPLALHPPSAGLPA